MPWQSIYNFKSGNSKRKESSPTPASDAGSSGPLSDLYAGTSQSQGSVSQGPVVGNAIFSATEHQAQSHVNFAADAWPSR